MTRKSTPKYEVVHAMSGIVMHTGISRTDAEKFARQARGGRKGTVFVRPILKMKISG